MNIYSDYVPTYSKNSLEIKKKIEEPSLNEQFGDGEKLISDDDETLNDTVEKKLDSDIFKSFQSPRFVVTEKVVLNKRKLPKEETIT